MRSMGGWRAGWIESTRPIRAHWRRQRLRLHGLAGVEPALSLVALGVIFVACGIVLIASFGAVLPGLISEIPGRLMAEDGPVAVPGLAVLFGCVGLAVGAAAIAAGSAGRGRSAGRLFAVVVLMLAGVGGLMLASDGAVRLHATLALRVNPLVVPAYEITTLFAFIGAIVVAVAPLTTSQLARAAATLLAGLPFLGIAFTILLAGDAAATLSPWVQAQSLDYPARLDLVATVVAPLLSVVVSAAGLLALLSIWQASEFSKAAVRHVGTALSISATRWTGLLAAVLVAKLAWLAAGLLGYLPPALGGTGDIWRAIRSDDGIAWAYAVALAVGGAWWLFRERRRISEERAQSAAARTVLLFAGIALLITAVPLMVAALAGAGTASRPGVPADVTLGECVGTWLPYGASAALSCLGLALVPWQGIWWFAVVAGAFGAGLRILRRSPSHGGGVFLAALGFWALPRAIDAVGAFHPAELTLLDRIPAINAPQPETFDLVLTVLIAFLALGWWSGRQRIVGSGPLLVILAISTLLVDGPSIAPSAPGAVLVAIGVLFPVLYELGFDSGGTNRPSTDRPGALLRNLGLRALALTVLTLLLLVDLATLQESTQAQLGFILFAMPLSATIVAATVRRRLPAANPVQPQRAGPLFTGALIGLATVVALGGLGWAFQPSLAGIYPTPSERVRALQARFASLELLLQTANPLEPGVPEAMQRRAVEEEDWAAGHAPPSCAIALWRGWDGLVADVRELGIVAAAVSSPPADPPPAEVEAVNAAINDVLASLGADLATVRTALHQATSDC